MVDQYDEMSINNDEKNNIFYNNKSENKLEDKTLQSDMVFNVNNNLKTSKIMILNKKKCKNIELNEENILK